MKACKNKEELDSLYWHDVGISLRLESPSSLIRPFGHLLTFLLNSECLPSIGRCVLIERPRSQDVDDQCLKAT